MSTRILINGAIGCFLAIFVGACSSAQQGIPKPKPLEEKFETREQALEVLVKDFAEESVFEVRYNPPLCPCPAYEILVKGVWVRIVLVYSEEEDEVVRAMEKHAKKTAKSLESKTFYLLGSLGAIHFQRTITGFPVLEFELSSYEIERPSLQDLDGEP
jgi:hypothetical protein